MVVLVKWSSGLHLISMYQNPVILLCNIFHYFVVISFLSIFLANLKKNIDPFLDVSPDQGITEVKDAQGVVDYFSEVVNGSDFIAAFINSLIMIIVTEIGDKTFFIAAVLAMKNGRIFVYSGAMLALTAMHLLSSLMGYALPALLSRKYTNMASTVLFVYFGFRLLKDASEMSADGPSEELKEVEEELIDKKGGGEGDSHGGDMEAGDGNRKRNQDYKETTIHTRNMAVLTQALTMTFLAEWGDRSQIATIALAASKNTYGVIFGGLLGHALCTGLAVIGGRMLAAKISERTVSIVGGLGFFAFALHSFITGDTVE